MALCPVILAGGGGTRLWPLSREYYPKQFLQLFDDHTLFQNTLIRSEACPGDIDVCAPLLICNQEHRFLLARQSAQCEVNPEKIILEPEGRNTAPALTIAALAQGGHDDAVLLMMPADHVVTDTDAFYNSIQAAYDMALRDYLVTFGIKPNRAETGYGYLQSGEHIERIRGLSVNRLSGFVEKPDPGKAKRYFASGEYLWNSGMFMMKATVWLEKIRQLCPDIFKACDAAYRKGTADGLFYRLDEAAFLKSPADSIDYAVMEKLAAADDEKLAVIPADIGWSDVGAWSSVWELNDKDKDGNHIEGDVIAQETTNCLIRSERGLIATVGCRDMVIVDSDDAILIADKNRAQEVREIVADLKKENRTEYLLHQKVHRPWGSYDSVDNGENFQVKRLSVEPGMKMSLQLHHKRSEHWVVVKGVATVTRGDEVFELRENESTFIPVGMKHRLENATDSPLEIIEVQSGAYLGEDDIVRFEDDFGRH